MGDLLYNLLQLFLNYVWLANLFFIIIILLIEKKNPLYTLLWIFLLTIFPYIGFFIYLFLGISFRKERVANKIYKKVHSKIKKHILKIERNDLKKWHGLFTYLEMSSTNSINFNNIVDVYHEGEDFFENLKKEIKAAKSTINMEYYIFELDNIGKEIADLLIEKSNEGVKVNLIVDGVNSSNNKLISHFKNTKVKLNLFFRTYIPIFNLRINYRNHRKITIIDSKIGFIGGMNIADEYLSKSKMGYWRDTSIKILGDAVLDLEKEFFFSLGIIKKDYINYSKTKYEYFNELKDKIENSENNNSNLIQVVSSGPNYQFRTLRDNFLKLIQNAENSIIIQMPYFVPDDFTLDALKTAILSGVDVKIMIPNKADHFFMYWVNQFYVGELLKLGATIYRYDKGFLHSKILIIDNEITSVGTCNFDYRSFYLNFEINVNIYDKNISSNFKNQFYRDINFSKKFELEDFEMRGILARIKESILRLLSPVL